jgi:response regulator NasT
MASSLPAGPVVRVLTADENREQLRGLGELLGRLGHEVVSRAVSLSEAAAMIAAEDPDASIVRLHRDDEHALALIEELSESATGPVIAVLDEADPEFISEAAARGIHAFAQPADDDNVQAALELAVHRHADAAALSERVDQLQTALERRAIIERAKGILMERHGVDDRTAFVLLRDHARRHGRSVVDVARSVDEGHALLPKEPR